MPDVSPIYMNIAEKNINLLHIKCKRNIYSERMFKTIINGSNKYYPLEKIEWMKDYLESDNQKLATSCLECLCKHGLNINDIQDILKERMKDKLFSIKAIEIAEKQNNPDILLLFMEEEYGYINRVILALKNTNHEDYLTTLMLSNNEKLVQAVNRITNK